MYGISIENRSLILKTSDRWKGRLANSYCELGYDVYAFFPSFHQVSTCFEFKLDIFLD